MVFVVGRWSTSALAVPLLAPLRFSTTPLPTLAELLLVICQLAYDASSFPHLTPVHQFPFPFVVCSWWLGDGVQSVVGLGRWAELVQPQRRAELPLVFASWQMMPTASHISSLISIPLFVVVCGPSAGLSFGGRKQSLPRPSPTPPLRNCLTSLPVGI